MNSKLLLFPLFIFLSSCNPMKFLKKEIKHYGYIPMTTPMEKSGTGTLVAGNPTDLSIIAPPTECFPEEINGGPTFFRFHDNSTLPTKIRNISARGKAKADLVEIAAIGGVPIGIGYQFERVETVGLEMKGVSIEYMNAPKITEYYHNGMSEICKIYLDFSGFIFQAIKVDQMIYTFYDSNGNKIELNSGALEEILDIGLDVEYTVENQAELIIKTPTYLGYQLGSLRYEDRGLSIYRASKVTHGSWKWVDLNQQTFKKL